MDWLKIAKDLDEKDQDKMRHEQEWLDLRKEEILASERTWIDRITKRLQEISEEGVRIQTRRKLNGLELSSKGTVDIDFLGHMCFSVKYKNIRKPTSHILTRPITVHHHRLVKLREMNPHNIEEILKFVALGMAKYIEISKHSRIEHNLEGMIESVNQEEHT